MDSEKYKLLLIVGLQKSGTTLLLRLLLGSGYAANPFQGEGNEFWGNVPPFAPRDFPAGTIYQLNGGGRGHEIGAAEATGEIRSALRGRLASCPQPQPVVVNKNPYNTVRLPWLRELFPEAFIIAMVRRPVPNVFSLLKKFTPHAESGLAPEDGWWGVKPGNWRELVQVDKVTQCARQWQSINACLWRDRGCADLVIGYQDLCLNPVPLVETVLARTLHREIRLSIEFPPLNCFDDEYTRGAGLRSKNRYFKETGDLSTPGRDEAELPPLRQDEIRTIDTICRSTAASLGVPS